jgi:hypothetical protein
MMYVMLEGGAKRTRIFLAAPILDLLTVSQLRVEDNWGGQVILK